MKMRETKVHLASSHGERQQDPDVKAWEDLYFLIVDGQPRDDAAASMRSFGIQLPDDPTSKDFERGWAEFKALLPSRVAMYKAIKHHAPAGASEAELEVHVLSALSSHALQARCDELEFQADLLTLDTFIAKAKADKKLTPAMTVTLRANFTNKEITLQGAAGLLNALYPIPAFVAPDRAAAGPGETLTWNGKEWSELRPGERASLKLANPDLYQTMRSAEGLR